MINLVVNTAILIGVPIVLGLLTWVYWPTQKQAAELKVGTLNVIRFLLWAALLAAALAFAGWFWFGWNVMGVFQ